MALNREVQSATKVRLKTHAFVTLNILAVLGFVLDAYRIRFAGIPFYLFVGTLLNDFQNRRNARVFYIVCSLTSFFCQLKAFAVFGYWIIAFDQNCMKPSLISLTKIFVEKIDELLGNMALPFHVGGNSERTLMEDVSDKVFEIFNDVLSNYKNLQGTQVEVIRGLGIAQAPLSMNMKPAILSANVEERMVEIVKSSRLIISGMVVLSGFYLFGVPGAVVGIAVFLCQNIVEDPEERINPTKAGISIADGVYRVTNYWCGVTMSQGIGTASGGILHVPYHVCHGNAIACGRSRMEPYYVSPDKDLVTYGGPPSFIQLEQGDELLVNCETDETRTTYRVEFDINNETGDFTWAGVTKPGESGSPIFALRDDKLLLVGLAGRYLREADGNVTEFALKPKVHGLGNIRKIVTHPGSGKTRKITPREIRSFLTSGTGKRILVTGPTRVVCRELYDKLKETFDVGLNIKGSELQRRPNAPVQIAAHATALRLLLGRDRCVSNLGFVIIDEAHYEDSSTIILRNFCRELAADGCIELLEMSATLDGEYDEGSNFAINDEQIEGDVVIVAKKELSEGKRVLVFVPGVESKVTKSLIKELREYNPIVMSKKTFPEASNSIKNLERTLIISTDIAECGINIPNLDVVIDTCTKFRYRYNAGVIEGQVTKIDMASRVQRRGRVGRTSEGKYMYYHEPVENSDMSSAQLDALIGMTGRTWSPDKSNPLNIKLTDKQFLKWITSPEGVCETPTEAWIFLDHLGNRRDTSTRMRMVAEWQKGVVKYAGCKDSSCGCSLPSYKWFDERLHDKIFLKPVRYEF